MIAPLIASNDPEEVVILHNPLAGKCDHPRPVRNLVEALKALELKPSVCRGLGEMSEWVNSRPDQLRCIVAAGGDGTFNAVVNRASGVPVTLLPLGNENLAARYFHVGRSAGRLAQAIAAAPVRQLDLGRVNGRLFSLMASVGFDAQVVHDVHHARRGHINKWNYVGPIMRALSSYPYPVIEVTIEETGEQLEGALVYFFNLPMYALDLPIARAARADDGCLDLLVFQRPGVVNMARYLGALVLGYHACLPDVQVRRVKRAQVRSKQPVPIQIDGDPAGSLPVTIEVAPAALNLIAPAPILEPDISEASALRCG
jgi:diacylglycerol kinase family enzyme